MARSPARTASPGGCPDWAKRSHVYAAGPCRSEPENGKFERRDLMRQRRKSEIPWDLLWAGGCLLPRPPPPGPDLTNICCPRGVFDAGGCVFVRLRTFDVAFLM